ncbi:MAG TPA: gephyrin-like molybdotransferase Glp [Gammaproteobacteria bacterium]|nr:gephyrin-like molybdotransferase Glp [Gammaproteobacteria bacterium]
MIALDAALARYLEVVKPLGAESVPIDAALDRVLAEPAQAAVDLPAFSQTAVDGYAVRAADIAAATTDRPVQLNIRGEIAAGARELPTALATGQTMRILTGAPLPPDCDAIVRQERVTRVDGHVAVSAPVEPGGDIRFQAEELQRGAPLGQAGQRVTPGLLAALAMAGVAAIRAHKRPRISVLITGDELVPAGQPLQHGQVHDANGPLVRAWLLENRLPQPELQYVRDEAGEVEAALGAALHNADLVITTGGVSVGDRDYIPKVAEQLGAERLFWKVAQKPGKPLYFARRNGCFLLGLPGNPAAVLIGLVFHARRVLEALAGSANPGPPLFPGLLAEELNPDRARTNLVRARRTTGSGGVVELHPLPRQGSHMLSNLQEADALVWVPPGDEPIEAGTLLQWTPL